jgi:predicted DNA-binding protein (MmcQ/YjbR family)
MCHYSLMEPEAEDCLEQIRTHCLSLPHVVERLSHGAPAFFIASKRSFATVWMHGHHAVDFPQVWCACTPDLRSSLMDKRPDIFFLPAYVAHRVWIGVRLDLGLHFDELADLLDAAYELIAPPSLR